MSGLPSGWESDYDGSRWFYRYKPTGQVQFRFPQDGDEFPDFVDAYAPAPVLAPEEKLESQQQVKRNTTASDNSNNDNGAGQSSTMRATAGPLGSGLGSGNGASRGPAGKQQYNPADDDDDGTEFYYQPESFMFLGPGAYSDVSPLADEDDRVDAGAKPPEAAKQKDGGNLLPKPEEGKQSHLGSKVSPVQSESTTPLVVHSTPVADDTAVAPLSVETQQPPAVKPPTVESPSVPLLDSREMPHELPGITSWNPIGVVAEMPTEHTAQARIETHPEPVEIGDSTVLAPIETRMAEMQVGIAELAESTSPTERKTIDTAEHDGLQQTSMPEHVLYQATFGTRARPQNASPPSSVQNTPGTSTPVSQSKESSERVAKAVEDPSVPRSESPFKIARKPTNAGAPNTRYQPYAPGVATANLRRPHTEETEPSSTHRDHRVSLIRDGSLMLGPREPAKMQPDDIPAVLQPPRIPPKVSAEEPPPQSTEPPAGYYPVPHHIAFAARQHAYPASEENGRPKERAAEGDLSHVPSVLKPARGKMVGQEQPGLRGISVDSPPRPGRIHHVSTMDVNQQPALGPRPWIQRVSTAPPAQQLMPRSEPSIPRSNDLNTPPPKPQAPGSYRPPSNHNGPAGSQPHHPSVVSPPEGRLPRQQSFASSEVSSLGPSSSRQSSIGNLQTPSPPENPQRPPSNMSGFFAIAGNNGGRNHTISNNTSSGSQSFERFPMYATPTRDPATRPASFSGPSASLASFPPDMGNPMRQMPPMVPKKIPLEPGPSEASPSQTVPAAHLGKNPPVQWPTGQQLPNIAPSMNKLTKDPRRRGTTRRHSSPQEQTTPPRQHLTLASGDTGLQLGSAQLQGERVASAPFHWTYPTFEPRSSSESPSHDSKAQASGPSAPTTAAREPTQPAERPERPSVGTRTQQSPARPSASTPVQNSGHALLPIQEHPESDPSRSLSQPTIPVYKEQPATLVRPGQAERAVTTHPIVQQPPPTARPAVSAVPGHQQNPQVLPTPQLQPLKQPVATQQYMAAPPHPLQHHQRSYSSPLGAAGLILDKEKEKEKGGWFSKFKKSSHKAAVLHKPPPPSAVQPQQAPFVQKTQQAPQIQRHSDEVLYRQPQQIVDRPGNWQAPSHEQGFVQRQLGWSGSGGSTGLPAAVQDRAHEPPGFPIRSSSDTIREASPVPPAVQGSNPNYQQPAPALGSGPAYSLPHGQSFPLDRQASTASSYAASISTVDIAEAYAQPILKPQLITVQRAATAPLQPPVQSQGRAGPAFVWSEQTQGYVPANQPVQQIRRETSPAQFSQQPSAARQLAPAPAITPNSDTIGVAGPSTQVPQRGKSKWTKRPAADYSGGDWGDDDWGN